MDSTVRPDAVHLVGCGALASADLTALFPDPEAIRTVEWLDDDRVNVVFHSTEACTQQFAESGSVIPEDEVPALYRDGGVTWRRLDAPRGPALLARTALETDVPPRATGRQVTADTPSGSRPDDAALARVSQGLMFSGGGYPRGYPPTHGPQRRSHRGRDHRPFNNDDDEFRGLEVRTDHSAHARTAHGHGHDVVAPGPGSTRKHTRELQGYGDLYVDTAHVAVHTTYTPYVRVGEAEDLRALMRRDGGAVMDQMGESRSLELGGRSMATHLHKGPRDLRALRLGKGPVAASRPRYGGEDSSEEEEGEYDEEEGRGVPDRDARGGDLGRLLGRRGGGDDGDDRRGQHERYRERSRSPVGRTVREVVMSGLDDGVRRKGRGFTDPRRPTAKMYTRGGYERS